MEDTLLKIIEQKKYDTDKVLHNYIKFYDSHFKQHKESAINVLEIGVKEGESLRLFRDYFLNATIHGVDIVKKNIDEKRIKTYVGDQKDESFFQNTFQHNFFDLIIDDGGHKMDQQQTSLSFLFNKYLKPGGLYVVEDLHTSFGQVDGSKYHNTNISTFSILEKLSKKTKFRSRCIKNSSQHEIINNLEKIVYNKKARGPRGGIRKQVKGSFVAIMYKKQSKCIDE